MITTKDIREVNNLRIESYRRLGDNKNLDVSKFNNLNMITTKDIRKVNNLRIEGYSRLGDYNDLDVSKYYDIRYPGENKVFKGCKIFSFDKEEKTGIYLNNKRHCEELKPSLLLKVNEKITTKKNKQKEKLRGKIEKLESEISYI